MKKNIVFVIMISLIACSFFAESRNALLIANGKYKNFGSLATPVKEARELKKTLETLGFKVTVLENAGKEKMLEAVDDFGEMLEKEGGIGFFHYGGHAVQVNGSNYLIPSDAEIPDEKKVNPRCLDISEIMANMNAETNIVVLDACRNNPLPATGGRSATRGLVLTADRPRNSIVIYSAQPGSVAQDGVFTPILTQRLLEKKELGMILREIRSDVSAKTNGSQKPGEYNELKGEVYLAGYAAPRTPTKTKKAEKVYDSEYYISLGNSAYDMKNYEKAYEFYQKAGQINALEAQLNLGHMYYSGLGVLQDYSRAFEWWSKAAAQGNAQAQCCLGLAYCYGSGVKQDYAKAFEWFSKATEQGYVSAQYNLGLMYYDGKEVSQDYLTAFEWFSKAAEHDHVQAQFMLGAMCCSGQGVSQDYAKAFEWFHKAAIQGNVDAQDMIGTMYEFGEGVNQDHSKAFEWYTKAALQGHAGAQNKLGIMCCNGQGVSQDISKAFEWFSKAAVQGNAAAQDNLGKLYYNGKGVRKDYTKAFEWFSKAAAQGNPDAQFLLGYMYCKGQGVKQNYKKTFELYSKSAEQGNVFAQCLLGAMYEFGEGVNQDKKKALEWYTKAAEQGYADAKEALKRLQ